MVHSLFAIVTFSSMLILASPNSTKAVESATRELGITETERNKLAQIADKKAKELGFHPERSNFRLTKENNLFKADYWPKEKKGVTTYGGNLTIYLDRKGHIMSVEISP